MGCMSGCVDRVDVLMGWMGSCIDGVDEWMC